MTEENTPFRHELLSGEAHGRLCFAQLLFMIGSSFSGICRYLFWDEGHEDNRAKSVALCVGSGLNNSLSSIWFQVRLPFHLTRDSTRSPRDGQRH